MNASLDGQPVRLRIESQHLVLIDPLALDGLSRQLADAGRLPVPEQLRRLRALGGEGLRIGALELAGIAPGIYEIGLDAFEAAGDADADAGVFEIDSGTVIVIDGGVLSAVATALTWDRYDSLLQSSPGDDTLLMEINREVGGPRFAIVAADARSPFSGDGAFRLRLGGLVPVR